MSAPAGRKLVLVVIDSLRTDMLESAAASGAAPTLAKLLERGELVGDCVSSFPSVTPVCTSEITTGARPDQHRIPGMNWYHRVEQRYVEYGSSFEATRTFGLINALYDTVYNMNMGHLSDEVETVFERLGDAGLRTACTPFLIYRGRTRHTVVLDGLLKRAVDLAGFSHAVYGPDELYYGELYASRKVACKPTLARPNTRDEYSACVGDQLVREDLYDFLLYSLPDNDFHSHRYGPLETEESIARADAAITTLADAAGGLDSFLLENAVIVMADHSQSQVEETLDAAALLGERWEVLQPNADRPGDAELAFGPSGRGGGVWIIREGKRARQLHHGVRKVLREIEAIDLIAWRAGEGGKPIDRDGIGTPEGGEAVIERNGGELRFRPGGAVVDRRGVGWDIDGDLATIDARLEDGVIADDAYPDALARVFSALGSPYAADVMVSLADGWELLDWGGASHVPGGSHGSLHADDSLSPLLTVALDHEPPGRDRWAISDVASIIYGHFGLDDADWDGAPDEKGERAKPR